MNPENKDFYYSDQPEPHKFRTREIIKTHPEIRKLIGRNPFSALIIIAAAGGQIFISYMLSGLYWLIALPAAVFIGAFASHCLYVLIHESAHNLIFKSRALNIMAGIAADIPNVLPSSVSFRTYHLKHHSFQGSYYSDADIPSKWEAKFIGNTAAGKSFWMLFFPVFQALRPLRLKDIKFANSWTFINWIVVFGVDVLVIYFFGWTSFLYLLFSFVFSIGLHPLGARWIQEHYLLHPPQETYSYYGILNIPALNVGYHNEHHDFPSVPWNKLPEVKKAAGEHYNNLFFHTSWFKLFFKFIFDKRISLFSRMVRMNIPKNNFAKN